MTPDPYDLPAPRSKRQSAGLLILIGLVLSLALGAFAGAQWIMVHSNAPAFVHLPESFPLQLLRSLLAGFAVLALYYRSTYALILIPLSMAVSWTLRHPLYAPWLVLSHQVPEDLQYQALAVSLLFAGPFGAFVLNHGFHSLAKLPRHGDVAGSARWASQKDLQTSGFTPRPTRSKPLTGDGVHCGYWNGKPLRARADQHAALTASPGSGKSVAFAIPTLQTWRDSAIILDVKGELWDATAGFRQRHLRQHLLQLNLTAERPMTRFNPLRWVSQGPLEVMQAKVIADGLLEPPIPGREDFWRSGAQTLIASMILHVLYTEEQPTIQKVRRLFDESIQVMLARMATTRHDPTYSRGWEDLQGKTQVHPEVARTALSLLEGNPKTVDGFKQTAEKALDIFADPRLKLNTAEADFHPFDFLDHDQPLSLYLTMPPSELKSSARVFRLFLQQLMSLILSRPVDRRRRRLLLVLDEFPLLGNLDFMEEAIGIARGFGVTFFLIVQGTNQLKKHYGPHQSLLQNCPVQICLGGTDPETAELISRRIGQRTVVAERASYSRRGGSSLSDSVTGRRLLNPDEVARLDRSKAIVLASEVNPILADRVPFLPKDPGQDPLSVFFEDPRLVAKMSIPPPERCSPIDHTWTKWFTVPPQLPTDKEIKDYLAMFAPPDSKPEKSR